MNILKKKQKGKRFTLPVKGSRRLGSTCLWDCVCESFHPRGWSVVGSGMEHIKTFR